MDSDTYFALLLKARKDPRPIARLHERRYEELWLLALNKEEKAERKAARADLPAAARRKHR